MARRGHIPTNALPRFPQQGFGNIDGEYWLGLENIYWLTNQGNYKLLVTMEDWSGRKVFAEYASFRLEPESEYYKLRLGRYHGNAGDSFTWHNGKQFTTLDRDHDVYTGRTKGVQSRWQLQKRGQPKPEPQTPGPGNCRGPGPRRVASSLPPKVLSSARCPRIPFAELGQGAIYRKGEGKGKRRTNHTSDGHSGCTHVTSLPEAPRVRATHPHGQTLGHTPRNTMLAPLPASHVPLSILRRPPGPQPPRVAARSREKAVVGAAAGPAWKCGQWTAGS